MILSLIPSHISALSISSSSSFSSSSHANLRRRFTVSQSSPSSIPLQVEKSESFSVPIIPKTDSVVYNDDGGKGQNQEEEEEEEGGIISGIEVPRQKHIPVSKSELLDAIVSNLFDGDSQEEIDQFLHLSGCLDSILHAEHKSILEEIRAYVDKTQPTGSKGVNGEDSSRQGMELVMNGKAHDAVVEKSINNGSVKIFSDEQFDFMRSMPFDFTMDQRSLSSSQKKKKGVDKESSNTANRFQHALVQLLNNAGFEQLSARDLMLTSALNTDYLLTLPIYVDWKKASDSKAIIFRRGYATERQKGLLIVEKLDYLQSKLVQRIFFFIGKPLEKAGFFLIKALSTTEQGDEQIWSNIKLWINDLPIFQQSDFSDEDSHDNVTGDDHGCQSDLPIWYAAERAVNRYEGILSSAGPRGRLFRKLLAWIGLLPSTPKQTLELDSNTLNSDLYLRPIFLPRISLGDLWTPASQKYCGNDLWKMFKTSIGILFSKSILQEPAFEELILLYTKEVDENAIEQEVADPPLQLKIYEKIPIPDLPVLSPELQVFPHKKLSFRIIDTVRLDTASILGLLAYFINYKFVDILSSPSAVILDVIGISALAIYASRVVLGYKQTWDRYQLLVNRTLYEKTVASGFGSVHFLIDASEQQQFKEAILAYVILLKEEKAQMSCLESVGEKSEKFIFTFFKKKVKMPMEKAKNTLVRLGIVTEKAVDGKMVLQAIPCRRASEILKERWASLLG